MALVVTPGASDADSYTTVAFADAYHVARGNAGWAGADAVKEAALRRATAWIDGVYRSRFPGYRNEGRDQALEWPRASASDAQGWGIANDAIPAEVQQAAAEAALREVTAPGSLAPDAIPAAMKILTTVGNLGWTPLKAAAGPQDLIPVLHTIEHILGGLIASGSGVAMVRG